MTFFVAPIWLSIHFFSFSRSFISDLRLAGRRPSLGAHYSTQSRIMGSTDDFMGMDFDVEFKPRSPKRGRTETGASGSNGDGRGGGASGGGSNGNGGVGKKMGENLDYRQRQTEALVFTTYKVPAATAEKVTPFREMLNAKGMWEEKNVKGKEHPWGGQRQILASALMKCFGSTGIDDLLKTREGIIRTEDEYAKQLGSPTIEAQLNVMKTWVKGNPNADQICAWLQHLQITSTKKADSYLVKFSIRKNHVFSSVEPLFHHIIQAGGGIELDGPAPRGPLYHQKKAGGK